MSDQVSHFSDDLLARITGSGRAPDFLGIGVQKGGTTWLYENLRNHPEIFMPRVKEIQYFNEIYVPRHRTWIGGHRKDGDAGPIVTLEKREAEEGILNWLE